MNRKGSIIFNKRLLATCVASAIVTSGGVVAQEPVEELVVTGLRSSLDSALGTKRNSEHVVEALDLSNIDAIPDVTIAEAIIRLPGVNGARDRGNQSQAAIRGLGPRMVFGTVNGREVASSEPGRSIRFEQYPSELISMVEVYKSQSADIISGGIAGTVNLETVSPLSYNGPEYTIRAGVVDYDGGEDIPDYDSLGDRYSASIIKDVNDSFGFALGYTSQTQKNAYPSLQAWGFNTGDGGQANLPAGGGDLTGAGDFGYVPWGIQAEVKNLVTEREAYMGVAEFLPNDNLRIKYDILFSEFELDEEQNQTWYQDIGNWDNGQAGGYSNATIIDNRAVAITSNQWTGNVRHVLAQYNQSNSVFSHGLNFDFTPSEQWDIEADIAYSVAERDNYWNALYLDSFGNSFSYDLRGDPSVSVPAGSPSATPETASLAISDWNEGSTLEDEALSLSLDFTKYINNGDLTSIDFGFRYADREKEVIWTGYDWSDDLGLAWVWGSNEVPANFPAGLLSSYTVGSISTSPWLNAPSYESAVNALAGISNFSSLATINQNSSWKVTEESLGAYAKANFEGVLGGIEYSANIGVRVEDIQNDSYEITATGQAGTGISNSTSEVLPSAMINFHLDDERILRVGLAKAMSRPPMDELRAGQYISAVSTASGGNAGNPNLKPFTSNQLDIAYEWYFAPESLFAASLYYKDIDNYVGYRSFDIPSTGGAPITIWAPDNGEGGSVQGIELTFQMPITQNFGIYSNYAYADTDITEFAPDVNPYTMAGLAEHTSTIDFWYSQEKFEARLGYKYHSGYTTGFEWDGSALRSLDSEENLGLSLSYSINENFSVRFQANNLTDEPLRLTQNNNDLDVRRYDVYGRTYLFDVTWKM